MYRVTKEDNYYTLSEGSGDIIDFDYFDSLEEVNEFIQLDPNQLELFPLEEIIDVRWFC